MEQLKKNDDKCKDKETAVAIYYEIIKEDSNENKRLDQNDLLTIAITSPEGHNYKEIESGVTSILDHDVNIDASILTILVQNKNAVLMKKFSLKTYEKISEKEITKISKKL